jgi:nonribosomal peptide synthetase protein BlmVI
MMPRTVGELLQLRARETSDALAYATLDDHAAILAQVSYGELWQHACRIARGLEQRCAPGSRIVLAYPSGIEFAAAFFGCVVARMIAVPVAAPRRSRRNERFHAILHDAAPSVVLTLSDGIDLLRAESAEAGGIAVLASDGEALAEPGAIDLDRKIGDAPDEIAYLQYTSGSISLPKGVMATHVNVLANSAVIDYVEQNDAETISLTWLPNSHDMGLIEGLIQPLYCGRPGLIIAPAAFLQRPRLWLEAISRHRVTNSGAPNFAYQLCLERAAATESEPLDLRSWRVAYNGAEPIRHDTIARFVETFAPYGFR